MEKQKKLKTQVQNILKSAQEESQSNHNFDNEFNDSMPHHGTNNILTTDEDMFVMEEEDHLQSHHITQNLKMNNISSQQFKDDNQSRSHKEKPDGSKIYNTHDGR